MFSKAEIGIDLGTANILIYSKSKGIVLNEPSIVAIDINTRDVVAVGLEAKDMVGKTPQNIVSIRPLKGGVIADYDVTTQMLKELLKKVSKSLGISMRKPTVIICTPSSSTSVERRARRSTDVLLEGVQMITVGLRIDIPSDLLTFLSNSFNI